MIVKNRIKQIMNETGLIPIEVFNKVNKMPPIEVKFDISKDWNRFAENDIKLTELWRMVEKYSGLTRISRPSFVDAIEKPQWWHLKTSLKQVQSKLALVMLIAELFGVKVSDRLDIRVLHKQEPIKMNISGLYRLIDSDKSNGHISIVRYIQILLAMGLDKEAFDGVFELQHKQGGGFMCEDGDGWHDLNVKILDDGGKSLKRELETIIGDRQINNIDFNVYYPILKDLPLADRLVLHNQPTNRVFHNDDIDSIIRVAKSMDKIIKFSVSSFLTMNDKHIKVRVSKWE